ncbi:hypothetical protein WDU94_003060 [Cyamophila willieti]
MDKCESSPLPLNKAAILNELKIRMSKKLSNRMIGKLSPVVPSGEKQSASTRVVESEMDEDEVEMLAIEDEYLMVEEEEEEDEMGGVSMEVNTSTATPTPTPAKKNNIQQFIKEVQNSIKGLVPSPAASTSTPKPPATTTTNFNCTDCDRIFIKEDELFHHTRLEHAEKTLLSKLNELKCKQPTTHYNLTKDTISPIKPVQILTSPSQTGSSGPVTPSKELAPLLTRKELQQTKQTVTEPEPPSAQGENDTEVIDPETGAISRIVKTGERELVMTRTTRGSPAVSSPRKIMMTPNGRIDKVLQRDGSCLIEYDKSNPVSVTSLETTKGAVAAKKPNAQALTITPSPLPLKPVLKTPLASKLVSQLCSALKNKATSPAPSTIQTQRTPSSVPAGNSNVTPSSGSVPETPDSVKLKRGPRGKIDEGVKQQALALLQQLNATDNRRKKRAGNPKQNPEEEDECLMRTTWMTITLKRQARYSPIVNLGNE